MVTVLAVASSLLAASPYYGAMFDYDSTLKCPKVSWLDPNGPLADAGVRLGDCLRADEQRFDEDLCPSLTAAPVNGLLKLRGFDGGTFVTAPADCHAADFRVAVELFVGGQRTLSTALPRDTKIRRWLELQKVPKLPACTVEFLGECTSWVSRVVAELPPALSFREAGCFTASVIKCAEPTRRTAWLHFPSGHVIAMGLKTGELPPPQLHCVKRSDDPAGFDCEGPRANDANPDAGEFHGQPGTRRRPE